MATSAKAIASSFLLLLLAAAAPPWSAAPWLADLAKIRAAIESEYPNRDWLIEDREVSLDRWFDRTADAIRASQNDADARRALDSLIERFNDGHVALRWPTAVGGSDARSPASPAVAPATPSAFCRVQGYDGGQVTAGTGVSLPTYRAIDGGGPFRAGLVQSAGRVLGVIRIGVFSPQGYPALCEQAVARLQIAFRDSCDAACDDRLLTEAYALMTRGLTTTVERLRAAGAQVLLVDVTRNGGGTEWAEAAARIVSPVPLTSARIKVIRGEKWVRRWRDVARKLRAAASQAPLADREALRSYAAQADRVGDGLKPCAQSACSRLADAGYATGIVAEMPAGQLGTEPWTAEGLQSSAICLPRQCVEGTLIILVDDETWSAAEQFTALLQDNGAAVVMGTRTGGAGCGHLYGNDPTILPYSGAKLELPNCVRLRRDGTNEVSGIVPDISTGVRWNDGPAFAGRRTMMLLPEAMARADALVVRKAP